MEGNCVRSREMDGYSNGGKKLLRVINASGEKKKNN